MRVVAGLILIVALAACSKQEPAPKVAAPVQGARERSAPDENASSGHKAPPSPEPSSARAGPVAGVDTGGSLSPAAPPPAEAKPAPDGAAIFADTCATCHMADGSGVPFLQPSIRGSAWISNPDPQLLLSLILRGSAILGEAAQAYENDMAPQEHLSDADIAAVATYVRTRFAATPIAEPVTPAQVAIARRRPGLPE